MLPLPSEISTSRGYTSAFLRRSERTSRSPSTSPWVRGVVPPTASRLSRFSAISTLLVGRNTTRASRPLKTTSATLSLRTYASRSSESTAPLVAVIRCSASMLAEASTTKTMRLPIFRSRTFWRRLRQKVRDRKIGNLIVFVVDASASMDAEQRMTATKGAVLSLLRDAYVRRDKVALVVFSGREARVVLRPTNSVEMAERRLSRLTVGGTTPLTHGLVEGLKLVRGERLKNPDVYPLLVLISDGRGNISVGGEEPLLEAQRVADQIKTEGIRAL